MIAFTLPALMALLVGSQSGRSADAAGETPTCGVAAVRGVHRCGARANATTLRLNCDARELRRRPWLYTVAPLAVFASSVLLYAHSAALFWRCLAYLALFHFVRQQLGWMRIHRRRDDGRTRIGAQLDELAIHAATVCPVVGQHTRRPRSTNNMQCPAIRQAVGTAEGCIMVRVALSLQAMKR